MDLQAKLITEGGFHFVEINGKVIKRLLNTMVSQNYHQRGIAYMQFEVYHDEKKEGYNDELEIINDELYVNGKIFDYIEKEFINFDKYDCVSSIKISMYVSIE